MAYGGVETFGIKYNIRKYKKCVLTDVLYLRARCNLCAKARVSKSAVPPLLNGPNAICRKNSSILIKFHSRDCGKWNNAQTVTLKCRLNFQR